MFPLRMLTLSSSFVIYTVELPPLRCCETSTAPALVVANTTPPINPLTTDDDYSHHRNSATCYQLAQSVLKTGSALAERVGQGEVGGCHPEGDSAWWLLRLAVEKPWSMPGGPLFCFLAQTGLENTPFIS